ncbi:hypothetical protein [Paraburkholderia unamae]|uniref:hypothetical protein n=1 Tax=Paraburkholderia unamae TaxID=219649 RepID=UPI0015ECBAC3
MAVDPAGAMAAAGMVVVAAEATAAEVAAAADVSGPLAPPGRREPHHKFEA